MKTLETQILTFAADEAQNISHGIFESAISLADCLAHGSISESDAREQLAELESELAEAAAE